MSHLLLSLQTQTSQLAFQRPVWSVITNIKPYDELHAAFTNSIMENTLTGSSNHEGSFLQ